MKLSHRLVFICILLVGGLSGTAEAVMVDFELPIYTAGSSFAGVDGWVDLTTSATVVTPATGDATVLYGSQSGRLSGALSALVRRFDAGPTEFGTGTTISGHLLVEGTSPAGGTGELFFTPDDGGHMPAGIQGKVGGNFSIFGTTYGAYIDTGIAFSTDVDYLLEIELNLNAQMYDAYVTNVTSAGPRTSLGTDIVLAMGAGGSVSPGDYATSCFELVSRNGGVAVYDNFDVDVVAPIPLLPDPVDFEAADYVAGSSVVGIDGWRTYSLVNAMATPGAGGSGGNTVLGGSKSLKVTSALIGGVNRRFGPGATYDDGTIISAKMMMDGASPEGCHGSFLFSDDLDALASPAGIFGVKGGNFWIFGFENGAMDDNLLGLDTGISFLSDVEYLLEVQLDLTNQMFTAYATNLTAESSRVFLGIAEFATSGGRIVEPGDDSNSGYCLLIRNGAVDIYDDLNIVAGTLPVLIPGDANRDGVVNEKDAAILADNWLASDASWDTGDFNDDNKVDDIDATILAANWQVSAASASVPEPSLATALLGLLLGMLLMRRRLN